jgi:hypothetical protein
VGCASNCKTCTTNGAGKCDTGECETDYHFNSDTMLCYKGECLGINMASTEVAVSDKVVIYYLTSRFSKISTSNLHLCK